MMFSYNALKLKGEADLSFDSSINQYNFLSSIFVSSLQDADLEEFDNGDIDLMIHLLIESSERLTNEEEKLIENKLYGKDLLYRLNLHSMLGASFEALEYNEDAIYHYEQAIKILRESKKRKIVKYQWGIIPIREPKLPSWESEIKVYEKKIELLKNFVVRNGKSDRRKSNYHFVQYTKEGFDALRDDKISGLHKKGIALSLELELLSRNSIRNKKINIKEFEDIRERALDLYPSKAIQLFWTKKFKRMAESRMNGWMRGYYNTIGFTYLNVAIDIKGQKKLYFTKKAKENFEQAIKSTAMIDYETIFQDIDEVSQLNKEKETYLMLIETAIELTSVIENKFKGNENSIEQIERKILNKGSVIYSNGGIVSYGSWINYVLALAKIKEDLDLYKFALKKRLEFNLKDTHSNANDIKHSIAGLMLLSIIRQDVSEIEDALIEIKKLNKLDDSELKNISQITDKIFGKLTNNINNSILFIKRQSQTKIEYIEENKPLYKIVSNFDDDGFLFNSTNFISNKVIFSDSGINENLIDVFKSIDKAGNNVLLKNNLNNKILTMKYNTFEIGFEGFSISIGVNLLEGLMENSGNAKVVVNSLESSDLLEFSSDNNPLKYAVVYGYEDLVQELIDKGSDLSNKCALGNTILHYAVFGKNINIVDKFIRAGVDINAKNNNGMSALYITVFNLQKEIVKILINNGANVNEITNEGSLLDAVEKFSKSKEISKSRDRRKNIRDIIKYLKRAGAKSANKKVDGKIFKPKINSNLISI